MIFFSIHEAFLWGWPTLALSNHPFFPQRREHEYDKFMRDTMVTAKNDFKSLLKETKLISYKSHDMIGESEKHYKDIVDVLKVKYTWSFRRQSFNR